MYSTVPIPPKYCKKTKPWTDSEPEKAMLWIYTKPIYTPKSISIVAVKKKTVRLPKKERKKTPPRTQPLNYTAARFNSSTVTLSADLA